MAFLDLATHFAGACFLAWFACWIGLRAWRCQAAAHWTERARLLWPARVTAGINLLLLPVMVDQTRRLLFPERTGWWIADGLAACLGALLGTYPLARSVFPELRFRSWLWQTAILCSLWGSVWIAMLAGVFLMPVKLGWGTVGVAGGYLAFNLALSWGLAVRVLRLVGLLRPPDETLERIVAESAARAAMPAPRAWLMGGVQALAFALPTTRQLVLSKRLLEICTEEEASAICAHELAHLAESKATLAGRVLGSLSLFPLIFMVPGIHAFGFGFIPVPLLLAFGLSWFVRWLSRRMERRADQRAAGSQLHEGVYARALEKLYRENQIPAVNVNNRQTHPHLFDRLLAAGFTPDFPRPKAPRKMSVIGWLYLYAFWFVVAARVDALLGRE